MKRDMYKSAIILKYDAKLMTSEEETYATFVFSAVLCCTSISTLIMSLLSASPMTYKQIDSLIIWLFLT